MSTNIVNKTKFNEVILDLKLQEKRTSQLITIFLPLAIAVLLYLATASALLFALRCRSSRS